MTRAVRRLGAVLLTIGGAAALLIAAPQQTVSAWSDAEHSSGGFAAGTVSPVTTLDCTAGLAQPVVFSWSAPSGGLTRASYRWAVTGGLVGSGTLPSTATSVSLSQGLLGLGSGTFSLFVVGPGGWESVAKTGTLGFLTGLISTCSAT